MRYTICFQDFGGNVFSRDEFDARDTDAAIRIAKRKFWTGIGRGYEILHNGEVVHSEMLISRKPEQLDSSNERSSQR